MLRHASKAALLLIGVFLFLCKLLYDLYSGAADGHSLNIAFDLNHYWWPYFNYISDAVRSGDLPLWNPYVTIGNSMIGAVGVGLFHPTTWTTFLGDNVAAALLVNQFLVVLICMAGAYCYASYLRLQWPARILCVTLFGYTTFTESFAHTAGASSSWFPFILYFAHRCFHRPTLGNAFGLAVVLSLCFFGGFANYFFYTCLIVAAYYSTLLVMSWTENQLEGSARRLGVMIVAVVLMGGIIAVQFLPAYELSTLSVRDLSSTTAFKPNSWWEKYSISLLFLNFMTPDRYYLFANNQMEINSGLFYLGGALLLLPFAATDKRLRIASIALAVSCGVMMLLILSSKFSVLSFITSLPLVGSLRMHVRGLVYVEFLLILLACLGLSTLGAKRTTLSEPSKPAAKSPGKWLPVAISFAIAAIGLVVIKSALSVACLLLCLGLVLYLAIASSRISRPGHLAGVIAAIIIIDISVHRENHFMIPAFSNADHSFADDSASDYRNRADYYRLLLVPRDHFDTYEIANLGVSFRIPNIGAYDNLTLARWRNYIRTMVGPERFDRSVAGGHLGWFYGDLTPSLLRFIHRDDNILGLASVRYLYTGKNIVINEHALPRAYAVHHYIETGSEEESLAEMKKRKGALRRSVILENAKPSYSVNDYRGGQDTGDASVQIKRYTPNEVELSVDVEKPALLVLTDAFFPGWEAYVDGNKVDIFRANSFFRAVEVGPDSQAVVFRYRPYSFYLGLTITLLSLGLPLLWIIGRRFKPGAGRSPRYRD
ncbi:MAG: YfhO family protein [Thiogranum sp.]